jgi:tetratricopeptide (TPR) repeat protein
MLWVRRITIGIAVVAAAAVMLLDSELLWESRRIHALAGQTNFLQDIQLLVVILFGLTGIYSVLFLLGPHVSAQILEEQSQHMVQAVQAQLRSVVEEMREIRAQGIRAGVSSVSAREPQAEGSPNGMNGREYLQLSARLRYLNGEVMRVYEALGLLFANRKFEDARGYLNQALALASDPVAAAGVHYSFACILAKHGDLDEAVQELELAFAHRSVELECRLAKDIEDGGDLYTLANTAPHDQVINRLLLTVSVGV